MAAGDSSTQFAEVIRSLDASKIPDKLHCPSCDKFLLNGWRLPCCDQTLCETCHSAINDRCPICEHQPISQDLCKPNKALRNTAKAYLKTAEKKLADERAKAAPANTPAPAVITPQPDAPPPTPALLPGDEKTITEEVVPTEDLKVNESISMDTKHPLADQPQPSIEVPPAQAAPVPTPVEYVPHVEGSHELAEGSVDAFQQYSQDGNKKRSEEKEPQAMASQEQSQDQVKANSVNTGTLGVMPNLNASGFPNMMNMNMGFDNTQMMQYMLGNGMGNFNPMMGVANMGMNPMSQGMFGGFGGSNMGMAGMNGMNMGMNFDPTQGMYGAGFGQNSNMWNGPQNNNPNAFANGMGGDFGSNSGYGYNMSQQGNFHQHQYPNGDFQGGHYGRGFGRGRGRGRGGFARGRGYNQNVQGNYSNYQQPYEQQQQEIQNMQAAMYNNPVDQTVQNEQVDSKEEPTHEEQQDQLNFAPGGQEEVQEALGEDYPEAETKAEPEADPEGDHTTEEKPNPEMELETEVTKDEPPIQEAAEAVRPIPTLSPTTYDDDFPAVQEVASADFEREILQPPMPPPSAPLGPAAQFADTNRDYGFRGRGHGRMSSRGRGSFHGTNGHSFSPVKPAPESPFKPPTEPKGTGVIGAPTGPKAMRAPPVNAPVAPLRDRGSGFQIVGRASMTSHGSKSVASENSRSVTPTSGPADRSHDSRSQSRHRSRHHHSRHESEDENARDRRRDRRRHNAKYEQHDDYEMQEADHDRARSITPEESRRSSHRKDRERDRDRHSKHKSSRSHRHREESQADAGDDGADQPKPSRDLESRTSRRDHHSSRPSRREERDREDSRRDHRKRSRRERDEDEDVEEDDSSRHRSRRHKRDRHEESVNGRQRGSERSSAAATPVEREREPEKDMHTLEREARNRERMLKEQQRRESAANAERGGGGKRRAVAGGRRVSYKYEDEAQSAMVEQEREQQRWR